MKYTNGVIRVASEELKRRIVVEIEHGELGVMEASRLYGFNRSAISKWLKLYGKLPHRREVVEVIMKDEKEKLSQLQEALSDAHLKIKLYEKMMEIAKDEYDIDLKKNYSTKALEALKQKESKGSAK